MKLVFFMPGIKDKRRNLIFDDYLYGRDHEIEQIKQLYQLIQNGGKTCLFISGFSGVGKTSLVTKILKPLAKKHGRFISGKYDQILDNPNQALLHSLTDLANQIIADTENKAYWKAHLTEALSPNTQMMINLIPELTALLGPQQAYVSSDLQKESKRMSLVLQKFIDCVATKDQPLVIFLDDLQRASVDAIAIIQTLILNCNGAVMFVSAYRENECTDSDHPIHQLINVLKSSKDASLVHNVAITDMSEFDTEKAIQHSLSIKFDALELDGINQSSIQTHLSDMLQMNAQAPELKQLSQVIYKKTHGNPFFIKQLLMHMKQINCITFDEHQKEWQWSIDTVNQLSISDNVVELATDGLLALPSQTKRNLQYAACLGSTFDLNELSIITGDPPSSLLLYLWHAQQHHLIAIIDDNLEPLENGIVSNKTMRFLHDKIQQAAYELTDSAQQSQLHWDIGYSLYKHYRDNSKAFDEKLLDIVHHLNKGPVNNQVAMCESLATLNIRAAEKAKQNVAFQSMRTFLYNAVHLFEGSKTVHPKRTDCYRLILEAEYLCSNYDQTHIVFNQIKSFQLSTLDMVGIHIIYLKQLASFGDIEQALCIGQEALSLLKIPVPRHPKKHRLLLEFLQMKWNMRHLNIDELKTLNETPDKYGTLAIRLLSELIIIAHNDDQFILVLVSTIIKVSLKYPCSYLFGYTMGIYGFILGHVFKNIKESIRFGEFSYSFINDIADLDIILLTEQVYMNFILPYTATFSHCGEFAQTSFEFALGSGNQVMASYCLSSLHVFFRTLDDIQIAHQSYFPLLKTINNTITIDNYHLHQALTKKLKDQSFDITSVKSSINMMHKTTSTHYYLIHLINDYLFGNYQQAFINYKQSNDPRVILLLPQISNNGLLGFLTAVKLIKRVNPIRKIGMAIVILKQYLSFKQKTASAPINFESRYYFMKAELLRLLKRSQSAIQNYDYALSKINDPNEQFDVALINEHIAEYHLELSNNDSASKHFDKAIDAYQKWGAVAKVKQLQMTKERL